MIELAVEEELINKHQKFSEDAWMVSATLSSNSFTMTDVMECPLN